MATHQGKEPVSVGFPWRIRNELKLLDLSNLVQGL